MVDLVTDPATAIGEVPRLVVETTISAVTVYVNRAVVTRRGVIALTGQERELILPHLPAVLQPESVQTTGIGTVTVQILGVQIEQVSREESIADRIPSLPEQIHQREAEHQQITSQLASLSLQRDFLRGLSEKSTEQFSQSLAHRQIDLHETRQLLAFLGEQYTEYTTVIAQTEQRLKEVERQLQTLRQELQTCETTPTERFRLIVAIDPAGPGEFVLEVSYSIREAGWTPIYDLTVRRSGDWASLHYQAEIQQQSGEAWTDATLTLSTSELGMNTLLPRLRPWYVEVQKSSEGLASPRPAEELAETLSAQQPIPKVAREGGIAILQLTPETTIPGDGTPHRISILQEDYPCQVSHVAFPRLVQFAYLQAIVTNPTNGITLLAGKVNLFRDPLFIGTIQLGNVAPGESFQLALGIDEGLKIERTLIQKQSRKKRFGQALVTRCTYRLRIINLRDRPVSLTLTEQLPISRSDLIQVRLTNSPSGISFKEGNLLQGTIALAANTSRDLSYEFTIEHPTDITIKGLDEENKPLS
ncbi:MAG: mucoidy inhibitor MuiA family protein [Leptolyngbyaceae cyanobacterium bins.59]|nr:mucoidy inhibitor MuiA family protein [Leptolyngbyaceae cyanobacterium bins.59]